MYQVSCFYHKVNNFSTNLPDYKNFPPNKIKNDQLPPQNENPRLIPALEQFILQQPFIS